MIYYNLIAIRIQRLNLIRLKCTTEVHFICTFNPFSAENIIKCLYNAYSTCILCDDKLTFINFFALQQHCKYRFLRRYYYIHVYMAQHTTMPDSYIL